MIGLTLIQTAATIVALTIFIKGFLPLKHPASGFATERCGNRRVFSKVVLMVVDALKTDFVVKDRASNWPYLDSVIHSGRAKVYNARAHPPTVTMPRIKALISGDIPGFIDVIVNFDSSELLADNLLYQINASGSTSIFYGDDTWLKLFPDMFARSEGTTSFFVSDYTEVDHNVTRHVPVELDRDDWDVMILHYLGLDHIGHLIGPSSSLVPPKLREMDSVVQLVHSTFKQKNLTDYLIIVCGDHGMADKGGHGGVTPNEVSASLVFLTDSVISGSDDIEDIYQIDLVPTLSSLLNLPIAQSSLGVSAISLMERLLRPEEVLSSLKCNAQQLMLLFNRGSSGKASDPISTRYEMIASQHRTYIESGHQLQRYPKLVRDYKELMLEIRENLASQLVDYDVAAMISGFIMLFTVLLFHICGFRSRDAFFLTILIAVGTVMMSMYYVHCTNITHSNVICKGNLGIIATALQTLMMTSIFYSLYEISTTVMTKNWISRHETSIIQPCLFVFVISHSLSLLASSFIEEEHQIAYFFSTSIVIWMLFQCLSNPAKRATNEKFRIIAVLACMTLARKWNQTGDKWAHLPDIVDKLNMPEYGDLKMILSLLSLPIIYVTNLPPSCYTFVRFISLISVVSTALYVMQDCGYSSLTSRGIYEADVVYLCSGMVLLLSAYHWWRRRYLHSLYSGKMAFVLLNLLLHRSVNLPLLALISFMEYLLSQTNIDTKVRVHLFYWLGLSSFFYQGNSNSLSTVDISAGYKGMTSYNSAITGCLTLCNTYSAPIFWMISLSIQTAEHSSCRIKTTDSSWLYLLFKLSDMVILQFLIILERYHLFIWTVFTPKLLYEIASLSIFLMFYSINNLNELS